MFKAALGGSVGNLQRVRAFLRVSATDLVELNTKHMHTWFFRSNHLHWIVCLLDSVFEYCADSSTGLWNFGF